MLSLIAFVALSLFTIPTNAYSGVQINPNSDTSRCLSVDGTPANGALVKTVACSQGNAGQLWDISPGNNPSLQLHGTNFCMDAGSNPANLVRAKIWTCYPGVTQQTWYYTNDNRIVVSGSSQCLDSGGSSGLTETYTCGDGNTNQAWTVNTSNSPSNSNSVTPSNAASTGSHQIHWNSGGNCLTVSNPSYGDGTSVQLSSCLGSSDANYGLQSWDINQGSGTVQLAGTNFCLDAGGNPGNGNLMKIWTCYAGTPQQTWTYTGDNRIAITGGSQCLDFAAGSANTVQTWQCAGNDDYQVWTMDGSGTAAASTTTSNNPPQTQTGGTGTYFYQDGNPGACGYWKSDSDLIAAVDQGQYNSGLCNKQIRITNTDNGQQVVATVVDSCPGCDHNSLDLSVAAFNSIADQSAGRVPISWVWM